MDPVSTQYVDRDGAALAYQVVGDGPVDVVAFWDIAMHLDLAWTDPDLHHVFERGASYSRTVYFQHRGFGLSDRLPSIPTLDEQAADVLAVMDAVGMRRATMVGVLATSAPVVLVAATAPERVSGLVLVNPAGKGLACEGELTGWTDSSRAEVYDGYRHAVEHWGSGQVVGLWDAMQATPYNRRLMALLERTSATPAQARSYLEWVMHQDIEDVLPAVQAPTRVLSITTNCLPEAVKRHVAELIPHATFHELPPTPPGSSMGSAWLPISDHVEEVATGKPHSPDADRYLGTVMFTDLVSSTELLERIGDAEYRRMRADHERTVRLAVETAGGRVLTVTGDGTLSVFEQPTAAVRSATTIRSAAADAGLSVRVGIHTGELERDGTNVTGLTVHIGARVGAAADPGQVLVSRTVKDLLVGSGLTFVRRGEHELKGVPGPWELFSVTDADDQPADASVDDSLQTTMDTLVLQTARRAPRLARAAVRLGNAVERRRART